MYKNATIALNSMQLTSWLVAHHLCCDRIVEGLCLTIEFGPLKIFEKLCECQDFAFKLGYYVNHKFQALSCPSLPLLSSEPLLVIKLYESENFLTPFGELRNRDFGLFLFWLLALRFECMVIRISTTKKNVFSGFRDLLRTTARTGLLRPALRYGWHNN